MPTAVLLQVIANAHLSTFTVGAANGENLSRLAGELTGSPGIDMVAPFGNSLHVSGRAAREHFAEGDIRDLMAAFGLVHVMRGDEDGEAAGGELVNLAPEIAPRFRIDAGGRLVEQQQTGVRQRAGAEREALLPAAGQLAGDLFLAAFETKPRDHRLGRGGRPRDAIDAGDEFEILAHREIVVEAEALRHVADAGLDLGGIGADVVTETGAAAFVRREQPAQHADGGGLAGAIGSEEAEDGAAFDLHGEVAHHLPPAERFGQAVHVDDDVGRGGRGGRCRCRFRSAGDGGIHRVASGLVVSGLAAIVGAAGGCCRASVTSTGWPTRNSLGLSGNASIRNTSLARSSRLYDDRWREFRLFGDESHPRREPAGATVTADFDFVAIGNGRQHRLGQIEAHLDVAWRQQGHDRPAGRHHFAGPEINLLHRAVDGAEHFPPRQAGLHRIQPRLRVAQNHLGGIEIFRSAGAGFHQHGRTIERLLRVLHRRPDLGEVGELEIVVDGEQRIAGLDGVALAHRLRLHARLRRVQRR